MTDSGTTRDLDGLDQDYQVRLTLRASSDVVFHALTTLEDLAAWWAPVTGNGLTGGELTFSFTAGAYAVMRVDAAERGVGVRWTTLACHLEDWVGTQVRFDVRATPEGGTELAFRHAGLTPRLECYGDCRSGWDHFVPSLRDYVETGSGQPFMSDGDVARRDARAVARASVPAR